MSSLNLFRGVALILYVTIPLQMGLIDGLAARSTATSAGLMHTRSSLLMHGCGPALMAGIAAILLRFGTTGTRESRRSFLKLTTRIYLVYLPVGLVVSNLTYRLVTGMFPSDLAYEIVVFSLAALVAVVFVACGALSAMTGPTVLSAMTLRVALGFVPLLVLDLAQLWFRLAGFRHTAFPVLIAGLVIGLISLYLIDRRR